MGRTKQNKTQRERENRPGASGRAFKMCCNGRPPHPPKKGERRKRKKNRPGARGRAFKMCVVMGDPLPKRERERETRGGGGCGRLGPARVQLNNVQKSHLRAEKCQNPDQKSAPTRGSETQWTHGNYFWSNCFFLLFLIKK